MPQHRLLVLLPARGDQSIGSLAQLDPDGARTVAAGFQRFNEAANEASVDDWVGGAS